MGKGIFPDDLNIATVTPIFKACNEEDLENYRSIYVLLCFSKIPENIMYNRLYKHLTMSKVLYEKTTWFSGRTLH